MEMKYRYLLFTAVLLPVTLCQEDCRSYENRLVEFDSETTFRCGPEVSQWWRSNERCGPFEMFEMYSECEGQSHCTVTVNEDNQRYFYYCCTGNVTSGANNMQCFSIQVCTMVIDDSTVIPPFVTFGQIVSLYVPMYAEPLPTVTSPGIVLQLDTETTDITDVQQEYLYTSPSSPELMWIFTFHIPKVENASSARLSITVGFSTANETCNSMAELSQRVLQVSNTEVVIATDPPSTEGPTGESSLPRGRDCVGCITGVVVVTVMLAVTLAVCILLAACLVWQHQIAKKKYKVMDTAVSSSVMPPADTTSTSHSAQNRKRPTGFLKKFRGPYNVLQSSATPTPITPGTRTLQDSIPIPTSGEVAAIPEVNETATTNSDVPVPDLSLVPNNGIEMQMDNNTVNRRSVADSDTADLDTCRDSRDHPV